MKTYIGTKLLNATPMTRDAYNAYRDWTTPSDEDGGDPGYLVEYLDGGSGNHSKHAGYISWSPKDVFERSYVDLEVDVSKEPGYIQRLYGELAELNARTEALKAFFHTDKFEEMSSEDKELLTLQEIWMGSYSSVLKTRLLRYENAQPE